MTFSMADPKINALLDFSDGVWGWQSPEGHGWRTYERDELALLAQSALAAVPQHGTMVEIGTLAGLSTSVLLHIARERKARLWACDPFLWMREQARLPFYILLRQFADVDVIFREQTSEEFYQDMAMSLGRTIDFLHIDGSHDERDVQLDCKLWLPLLKSGGLVAFHDYNKGCSVMDGLRRAVDDATGGWEQVGLTGTNGLLVRRKP